MKSSAKALLTNDEKIDKLLHEVLMLHGNESNMIKCEKTQSDFTSFVIALTKLKYNIRYCSNKNCKCHPESTIKKLFKNEKLVEFVNMNAYLKDDVRDYLDLDNYEHKTIFD